MKMKRTSPLIIIYPWYRGDNTPSKVDQKLSISTSQRMIMISAVKVMFYLLCRLQHQGEDSINVVSSVVNNTVMLMLL